MNTRNILASSSATPWMVLCVGSLLTATAPAQTQRNYPQNPTGYPQQPQYGQAPAGYQQPAAGYAYPQQPQKRFENPLEFLPKFGRRLSEMTRRLFYGRDATGWDQPPQGQGYSLEGNPRYPTQPGYAQPPAGYYPQQPAYQQPTVPPSPRQPGYSYPPGQTPPSTSSNRTAAKTPAPTPAPQKSSTSRTYTPPKVGSATPKTTKPKTSAPEPAAPTPPSPAPAPPPMVASRRSETTPPQEPPRSAAGGSSSFPRGGKTSKPGRVTSPYPPYKELDVTGLDSGSLALDPTTQKVFEVP